MYSTNYIILKQNSLFIYLLLFFIDNIIILMNITYKAIINMFLHFFRQISRILRSMIQFYDPIHEVPPLILRRILILTTLVVRSNVIHYSAYIKSLSSLLSYSHHMNIGAKGRCLYRELGATNVASSSLKCGIKGV